MQDFECFRCERPARYTIVGKSTFRPASTLLALNFQQHPRYERWNLSGNKLSGIVTTIPSFDSVRFSNHRRILLAVLTNGTQLAIAANREEIDETASSR